MPELSPWLAVAIAAAVIFLEDISLGRYRFDVPDNRVARRMQTRMALLRRLTVVVVVILALGAILLSFPGVEALGVSILASALLSIVAVRHVSARSVDPFGRGEPTFGCRGPVSPRVGGQ